MEGTRKKTSMSVREMGTSLGLGKTESYWLVKKRFFKTIQAAGVMRVMIDSFEDWYAHQFTYRKIDGTEPGQALKGKVLTYEEIQNMLGISQGALDWIISKNALEKVFIYGKPCIAKESYDAWYASQSFYRNAEDREKREQPQTAEITALSLPDIARLLGVSRDTVYWLVKKGCFETIVKGKRKQVPLESFESWYGSQTHYKKVDQPMTLAEGERN